MVYFFYVAIVCTYKKMRGVVKSEGVRIAAKIMKSHVECGAQCNYKKGCESFTYFDYPATGTNCYLYDKKLTGSEPLSEGMDRRFASYFKICALGMI